ncbi:MAG: translocation and assembly module protein TamB [Cereibacter sphaeroides]|uniref:Translocation and assembly module protein TamB n=1 Tax=Cereibacter sphaeroides TaxID=1063 RepID=A0A2W5UIM2_CERSP|nr:MAG: translocation and assembly module protein TamB [Cereibacter sphaeroides]
MWRFLILCFALLTGPAMAQQEDVGILTRFVQEKLSGAGRTVEITGFRGALSSRATIEEMTIADGQGIWLTLRGITLDWNRASVLRGRISVNELSAQEIIVARRPVPDATLPSPEAKGFSLPELPVSIDIGKVAAQRLELGETVLGTPIEASLEASMQLAGGQGQMKLSLVRLDSGPSGKVTLDSSYSNTTRELKIDLDAEEGAGGIAATKLGLPGAPATSLQIRGQGLIDDFSADIRLATDQVDRLSGRVTLTTQPDGAQGFTASLGGDPAPLFLPQQAAFFGNDVTLDVAGQRSAIGALELSQLQIQADALAVNGTLKLAPGGLPREFALRLRIAQGGGVPVLLPIPGDVRVGLAEVVLNYDAAQDDGWRGSASLQGLQQPGLSVANALITGSGRIKGAQYGNVAGGTLNLIAAGIAPNSPALAQAIGAAATGRVKISWQEGQPVNLSDLTIAGSDFTIQTRGRISGLSSGLALNGRIEAEASDISRFSGLAGRPLGGQAQLAAQGSGSVLGGDFDLTGSVQGQGLRIGQPEADNLLKGSSQIAFSVARSAEGTQIRSLDVQAATLDLSANGWIRTSGSDLSANLAFTDLGGLGSTYRGSLKGTAGFTGTAQSGRMTLDATGQGLAIGQPQADLLLRGTSTLSVATRIEGGAIHVDRAQLQNPQLTAQATGDATGDQRQIDLSAKLADMALLLPDFPGALTIQGTAMDNGQNYRLDVRAAGPGQINARISGQVARNFQRAELTIAGSAQAGLANAFIAPRNVAGPVTFDLRLNGPLALNAVSGKVALNNGRIAAPALRLALDGVNAQADLSGGRATVRADARLTTGGRIGVTGPVSLTPPFEADLSVTGRDLVLTDPELYEVKASGDLRVSGPLTGGARISGVVNISEAELRVPNTPIGGSGAIPDLVFRGEPADVRATRVRAGLVGNGAQGGRSTPARPFGLDVTINAPNQIFVRGRGLDAELGGQLRLGGTTDAVVPSGGIDLIRGRLDILGRRLDLSEAQIQLEGNLDATVRVVASNVSEGVTSSVVISGKISEPDISFTSSPPLPEEEVLAHLLFGRDLTTLSPFQAAQLANAVATLAGRGGEGIIGRLRRDFGLDDLDFVTDSNGGTSLRLGRYVAKNVYTEVVVGGEGKSQLNLNLDIRPGVTARGFADSEGDTGFGLFVERDY